jgi:hypothetical protein
VDDDAAPSLSAGTEPAASAPDGAALTAFVEAMGLAFRDAGGSRMMGRVLGHLLVCEPEVQTAADLGAALGASAGSISTVTRQLVAARMAERVALPGERATGLRLVGEGWVAMMEARMGLVDHLARVGEAGLASLGPAAREARGRRLRDFVGFYRFLMARMPDLFAEWRRAAGEEAQ